MTFLNSLTIRRKFTDALAWAYSTNGMYLVKYLRHCLETSSADIFDNSNLLWKGSCPPKVKIFALQLRRGRIMVRDVLHQFGMVQGLPMNCLLCNNSSETIDHLFMHCHWAWKVWILCMNLW
ncbi:hypothetical protein Dsin_013581 [Dipteronia sinensis]|uniref:Reverse transcriptase zinc-binding domain-containing protein n=1 Tax=Dipteronia sinensis TaxID=43782 RepID=A0AAE0AK84_9ROSI|nr:hypothetical protein Dsin_013581 [Dipteronia sinensis]